VVELCEIKKVAERVGFEHFGRSMRISMLRILEGTSLPCNPLESPHFPPDLPPAFRADGYVLRHSMLAQFAFRDGSILCLTSRTITPSAPLTRRPSTPPLYKQ
jgi:hypothetical protein